MESPAAKMSPSDPPWFAMADPGRSFAAYLNASRDGDRVGSNQRLDFALPSACVESLQNYIK
jgi:hypothetical protein